jgi:hypothetical protein
MVLPGCQLGFPPALNCAEDASCGSNLDDFAWDERGNGHGQRCGGVVMSVVVEPGCANEENRKSGDDGGDQSASKARGDRLQSANDPSCGCCGQRVGEEKAAVGAEQMGDAAGSIRGEDRQAKSAFGEVKNHCGEASDRAERHADEDDGKVLEREWDGREGKRKGDVCAGGYERGRTKNEESLAGEGFLKRSETVGEAELGGDGGLHRAGSFRARSASLK